MYNFEDISKTRIVLVDFYAKWCGPCKMIHPVIDEIENEHHDILIYKIDVDEKPDIAKKYGIMSIPTIIIFKDGKIKTKFRGITSKQDIIDNIK